MQPSTRAPRAVRRRAAAGSAAYLPFTLGGLPVEGWGLQALESQRPRAGHRPGVIIRPCRLRLEGEVARRTGGGRLPEVVTRSPRTSESADAVAAVAGNALQTELCGSARSRHSADMR